MKLKIIFTALFYLFIINSYTQTKEQLNKKQKRLEKKENRKNQKIEDKRYKEEKLNKFINPKGNWFFGAEIGSNKIHNYNVKESKTFLQGGLLAEYYFARHWSLSTKLKFYKTGVSFYQAGSGGLLFGHSSNSGTFRGGNISIPLNIKWEFRIHKNFGASLKLGASYNKEIKSDYSNYTDNQNPESYSKNYISPVFGYGLNYFLDNKSAVYLDVEIFSGSEKGEMFSLFSNGKIFTSNSLISIGYKFNFLK